MKRWPAIPALLVGALALARAAAPPARPTEAQLARLGQRDRLQAEARRLLDADRERQAAAEWRKALAIEREVFGDTHPEVAHSLLSLARLCEAAGDTAGELAARREAVAIWRRLPGARPWLLPDAAVGLAHAEKMAKLSFLQRWRLDRARALNSRAVQLHAQGKAAEALAPARDALKIDRELLGDKSPVVAQGLDNLGVACTDAGEFAEARRALDEAARLRRELFGREHPHHAASLHNLARLLSEVGQPREARRLYHEALGLLRADQREREAAYAIALGDLAVLEHEAGDLATALPLTEQAVALQRDALGEKDPSYGNAVHNLAALHLALGDLARARELADQAVGLMRKAVGPRHPVYAHGLSNRAAIAVELGELAEARRLYEQAANIYRRPNNDTNPEYARAINNLAGVDRQRGDFARAVPLMDQAARLAAKSLGEGHPLYATCLNNLASLHESAGDGARARVLYERSQRLRREVLGEKHPEYAAGQANLAALSWSEGKQREAVKHLTFALDTLHRHLGDTMGTLSVRQRLDRIGQLGRMLDVYLSFAVGPRADPDALYAEVAAWKGAHAGRAAEERLLRDDPSLRPLLRELAEVRAGLAWMFARPAAPAGRKAWRQRFDDLERRKEGLEVELARKSAAFRGLRDARRPDASRVRAALPAGAALVEFVAYRHKPFPPGRPEHRLLAFVIRPGAPTRYEELGALDPVTRAVRAWRHGVATRGDPDPRDGQTLRGLVWEKLRPHLRGAPSVLIAPDGELCSLPFAALPGEKTGTYLIEDVAIGYVPSGRQLPDPRPTRPGGGGLLVLGDPAFGSQAGTRFPAWARLPAARLEADRVAELHGKRFPRAGQAALAGPNATREKLLAALARKPRWLHLATHAYFDRASPDHDAARAALAGAGGPALVASLPGGEAARTFTRNPLLSTGLVLAGELLPAEEVSSLDLRGCELVTLSACETGLGPLAGWQGVQGLQRAFHDAGAGGLVTSLWSVSDAATSVLMEEFYKRLWGGEKVSKLEALRQAQLHVLRNPALVQKRYQQVRGQLLDKRVPEADLASRGLGRVAQAGPAVADRSPVALWGAWALAGDAD